MTELKKKGKSSSARKSIEKICNYILPLILLFIYVAIAAGVYYAVEKDCKTTITCPAYYLVLENATLHSSNQLIIDSADNVTNNENVYVEITKHSVHHNLSTQAQWFNLTYWSAFHFVAISVTTIGYGDIYPCTDVGQFLIVLSCVLGIPMTLITVARLCRLCEYMYHLIWAAIYRAYKKNRLTERDNRLLARKYYIPLWIGLPVPTLWIFISSTYFYIMLVPIYSEAKEFTYFTSFYFTMISFLTIGFGDYAPLNYYMIMPTFLFILIGLALVTMGANSVQVNMELMYVDRVEKFQSEYAQVLNGSDNEQVLSMTTREERAQALQDKHNSSFAMKVLAPFAGKAVQQQLIHQQIETTSVSIGCQANVTTYDRGIQADLNQDGDEQVVVSKRNVKFQVHLDLVTRRPTISDTGMGRSHNSNINTEKWPLSRHSLTNKSGTFRSKVARRQLTR